jgi:outer membrane protein assembly factor BamB
MVFPLDKILPGQRTIQSGFGRGKDGVLYAGTTPDRQGDAGHLIAVRLKNGAIDVSDLGIPVPGEGVFALTCDPARGALYGISNPSGKFFAFSLESRRTEVVDQASSDRRGRGAIREYALTPEDVLSRRLVVDKAGRVYGSQLGNKIFRFDPSSKKIELLPNELPEVWGRRSLGRVDSWALAPDGTIYGGNAGDGQLFKIDPATGNVVNLGKPAMMPRLKGLAFGRNGVLYGVSGGSPGYSHLFTYSASGQGFVDLGNPRFNMSEPGIEQGIAWRGFQIGTLAASEDGRYIVIGEEEALSQLMVFPVE